MKKLWVLLMGLLAIAPLSSNETLITPQLCELLDITGVQCEKTLPSIVEATQKAWLRPAGKERWEMEERLDAATQARIVELCSQMGLLSEVYPQKQHYRYCIIMGASLPTIHKRMQYAEGLWLEGIRFDELVFLTGDRTLDERIDRLSYLPVLPENETQGMLKIFETLPWTPGFKDLPLTVVDVPKQSWENGLRRPSTPDTVNYWVKNDPTPGSCLFVTNQPYNCYHAAVVKGLLPTTFSFEIVGPAPGQSYFLRAGLLLDNIARWLYQESLQ